MKAIVFGGAGFLGSHISDTLSQNGIEVTIFDIDKSQHLNKNQKMIVGDILDEKAVERAIEGSDYVLNFAGVADLAEASKDPSRATRINIQGNLNILEAMRKYPPKRYLFASTYYVYSESGSIYRITKQSCELFIEEYQRQYGLEYTILRYGSLYGPRSDKHNFVYRIIDEAVNSKTITRDGDGDDIREYIHVKDAAKATYNLISDSKFINKHIILAGHQRIKVKELFEMIDEMMGNTVDIKYLEAHDSIDHYKITPYTFRPQVALRYKTDCYHDLGQGILQMMHDMYEKVSPEEVIV